MKFVKVKNGNYTMYLDLETGTKIRKNDLDFFDPSTANAVPLPLKRTAKRIKNAMILSLS